jgi:F0F1-type ATP synthase membrane subunit c/vacuolar-type H+-ATPase subunit K
LIKNTPEFRWTPQAQSAFEQIKDAMVRAPVMVILDTSPNARYTLCADAFGFAVGGGAGIGIVFGSLIKCVARNPSLTKQLFGYAIFRICCVVARPRYWTTICCVSCSKDEQA